MSNPNLDFSVGHGMEDCPSVYHQYTAGSTLDTTVLFQSVICDRQPHNKSVMYNIASCVTATTAFFFYERM